MLKLHLFPWHLSVPVIASIAAEGIVATFKIRDCFVDEGN